VFDFRQVSWFRLRGLQKKHTHTLAYIHTHTQTQTPEHLLIIQASTHRLLDLIACLSPEYNLFVTHAHSPSSWRALPSTVTWAGAFQRIKRSRACLALRSKAMSQLGALATSPCAANGVQDALLAAFVVLSDIVSSSSSSKADDADHRMGILHIRKKKTVSGVSVYRDRDEAIGPSRLLSVLAPTLVVGGALDVLFLRANLGEEATYVGTSLRNDVMDAFVRACDSVLAADWEHMPVLGEMMRARMTKALWELLASQVCILYMHLPTCKI
jgi:hypothetical protein